MLTYEPTNPPNELEFERQFKLAKNRTYMRKRYANMNEKQKQEIRKQAKEYKRAHPERAKVWKNNWNRVHSRDYNFLRNLRYLLRKKIKVFDKI